MCVKTNWSESAGDLLRNYSREVFVATKVKGWDGRMDHADDDDDVELQWTFAGSLLFSITVVTTIGRLSVIACLSLYLKAVSQ